MTTATHTPDQAAPVIAVTNTISIQKVGAAYVFWMDNKPVVEVVIRPGHTFVNWNSDIRYDKGDLIHLIDQYEVRATAEEIPSDRLTEMTTCPVCKRRYATSGRSIHYCHPSHEYIAHFDNQQVGAGYPSHTAAETALDDHCWWLSEAGLVGELDAEPEPALLTALYTKDDQTITVETAENMAKAIVVSVSHGQFRPGTEIRLSALRAMGYFRPEIATSCDGAISEQPATGEPSLMTCLEAELREQNLDMAQQLGIMPPGFRNFVV